MSRRTKCLATFLLKLSTSASHRLRSREKICGVFQKHGARYGNVILLVFCSFFITIIAVPCFSHTSTTYLMLLMHCLGVEWFVSRHCTVYLILLLYPPENPVPSLSFHNLLLWSLLCPYGMLILVGFNM